MSLRTHHASCRPDAKEDSAQMDGHGPIKRGQIDLSDSTSRTRITGIVEETVEATERIHRQGYGRVDILFLGHVRMHEARSLAKFVGDSLSSIVVNVGYDDRGAFTDE
jgi:hypothetical protein